MACPIKFDWNDFTIRAIAFGLAPQLQYRFAQWQTTSTIPARASAKLKVSYVAQKRRSDAIYEQLAQVLAACPDYDLQPIVLKGAHLAAKVYAEPALRPMNDIDLLFAPESIGRAEQMLSDLGYGGKHKSAETGAKVVKHTSTFKKAGSADNTPNPYLSSQNDRMIEPHTSLEESWFGLRVDITRGVRKRAIQTKIGEHSCLVLHPTDLLLHICVHYCFHLIEGAPVFVQFSDILAIIQQGSTLIGTLLWRVPMHATCRALMRMLPSRWHNDYSARPCLRRFWHSLDKAHLNKCSDVSIG